MDSTFQKLKVLVDIVKECCDSLQRLLPNGTENYWMLIADTVILEDIQELFSEEEIKLLGLDFDVDARYFDHSSS